MGAHCVCLSVLSAFSDQIADGTVRVTPHTVSFVNRLSQQLPQQQQQLYRWFIGKFADFRAYFLLLIRTQQKPDPETTEIIQTD